MMDIELTPKGSVARWHNGRGPTVRHRPPARTRERRASMQGGFTLTQERRLEETPPIASQSPFHLSILPFPCFSNRDWELLESSVIQRKQSSPPSSNRDKIGGHSKTNLESKRSPLGSRRMVAYSLTERRASRTLGLRGASLRSGARDERRQKPAGRRRYKGAVALRRRNARI